MLCLLRMKRAQSLVRHNIQEPNHAALSIASKFFQNH